MKFNSLFQKLPRTDREIYKVSNEENKKILQEINHEITNKFKVDLPSRNSIIKAIIQFLSQGEFYENQSDVTVTNQDFIIIKSDIRNFFPSINKHQLYKKLIKPSILNEQSIEIIKSFIFTSKISGVPLGMPFSNALAEIYIEEFDKEIRFKLKPIFYFRYVDDIFIIQNYPSVGEPTQSIKLLSEVIAKYKLELNSEKTKLFTFKNNIFREYNEKIHDFDFLGYKFTIENRNVVIDISDTKFNKKLLNRIIRSFKHYSNSDNSSEDFWILYYRLKNLIYGITSNGENGVLKYGLGYSYRHINSTHNLKKLLATYHYFVNQLRKKNKITSTQRGILYSIIAVSNSSNNQVILSATSDDSDILLLLKKRFNYTNLSKSNLIDISKKINSKIIISNSSLDKYNLQIQIMKKLSMR